MSTTQVPNPSRPRITNKTLMQRYDGMHRGLRGCQGRLNGGIEMPFCERSTGYAEARVNIVNLASEADGLRRWVSLAEMLHCFRSTKTRNRKPGKEEKDLRDHDKVWSAWKTGVSPK